MKAKTKRAPRPPCIQVKVTDDGIREALQAKADRHAQGNLSAWLRHAGMKYEPKKGESIIVFVKS